MTVTIYIDVLICINLIVNYFILSLSFKYVKCKVSSFALLRGALAGAVMSLVILLPEMHVVLSVLTRLVIGIAVVFAASLKKPLKVFLKLCAVFMFITFALCGIVYFLYMTFLPDMFYTRNGSVYADISPITLVSFTGISYILFTIIDRFSDRALPQSFYCNLSFDINGKEFELFGKIDSGNSLKEPFSQSPVIIVSYSSLGISDSEFEQNNGIRVIPYNSVGGSGILKGIKAHNLKINKNNVLCDVYLAPCSNAINTSGIDALLSCELLEYNEKSNQTRSEKHEILR